jgi:hypothetical protein
MPIHDFRPLRRSKRLWALLTTCVALSGAALAMPSSASAYEEPFCVFVYLGPGSNCYAENRHSLQAVRGVSSGWQRICASSAAYAWGPQNSLWRCDYGEVIKYLDGRAGVGLLHNGDPNWMGVVGWQYF